MSKRMPDYRGIYRNGGLTLVQYVGWMPSALGYVRPILRDNHCAVLADFEVVRGHDGLELIVTELTATNGHEFRDAVIGFAEGLGYRRVWMAHDVIDLDPLIQLSDGVVSTCCPACGSTFAEDAPEFMIHARRVGVWPCLCPVDGHPIPQWCLRRRSDLTDLSMVQAGEQTDRSCRSGPEPHASA